MHEGVMFDKHFQFMEETGQLDLDSSVGQKVIKKYNQK